jgi:N-acetylmuramoyl-L-alanine amidase
LKNLILFFALFPTCVWADDISIDLTPTNSSIPTQIEKVQRIVIDPGNGGKDFGAIGYDQKLMEKDVNLKIAKKVVDILKRKPDLDVLITRNGDDDISDKERTDFANSQKANLFISIHCNQSESDKEAGTIIYVSKNPNKLVSKNEKMEAGNQEALFETVSDLRRNSYENHSNFLAEMIEEQILKLAKQTFRNIQKAPFYIFSHVDMPSLWISMAYITNKDDVSKLNDPKWQNEMAEAIAEGILTYKAKVENNF